ERAGDTGVYERGAAARASCGCIDPDGAFGNAGAPESADEQCVGKVDRHGDVGTTQVDRGRAYDSIVEQGDHGTAAAGETGGGGHGDPAAGGKRGGGEPPEAEGAGAPEPPRRKAGGCGAAGGRAGWR